MRPLPLLAALLVIMICGVARPEEDHDRARNLREKGKILPLEEIVRRAQERQPGKLLEAELEKEEGRLIYKVEILDEDGIVWDLTIDAKSGELLAVEGDD
ncbi:MAG TPA: PepSY domain-containing protein [Nitrospiria bacterium]|nr:PepSY domain-containing protein [Nitrospiria bacterium]